MLKKLNSFVLAFAILISCITVCNANDSVKAEAEPDRLAYALNITNKKNFKKTVTRGDAAGIVLRLLGYKDAIMESGELFDDVSENDENAGAIYTAYKLGIISGTEGASYEPDANVTYEQLMKMLVTALGYEDRAADMGGYPHGYTLVASELKLDRNVIIENNEKLDVKTVSQIAENALEVELLTESNNVVSGENDTLLYKAFKLRKYNGVVTAVYGASYTPNSYALETDDVYINDVQYKKGEFDVQSLIGYYVDFYVKDNFDEPQIVVYAQKKKHNELELELENINKVDIDRRGIYIEYYETATSKRPMTESLYFDKTSLIYNGYYTDITKSEKNLLDFSDGSARLIDYDNDGDWDFFVINRLTTAVVKTYSSTTKILTLEYPVELGAESVQILDFTNYDTVVFDGQLDYSTLKVGDVLDIRMPKNDVFAKKVIRLSAVNRIIRGELTQKESNDGKEYIWIDEQVYELSDDYASYAVTIFDGLQFGVDYTLYLTAKGKIAYIINHLEEERVYGYLTNMAVDSFGEMSMKVFMADGKFHYLDFADKVRVYRDGVDEGYKTPQEAASGLFIGDAFDVNKAQLIRFMPDKNSKIRVIEFAQNELGADAAANGRQNGSFIKSRSKYEGYYFHVSRIVYTSSWMPVFAFPANAVCFTVPTNPEDLEDEDNFSVGSYTGLRGNILLDTYNDDESGVPEIFVNYGGADKYLGFAYNSSSVVVKEIKTGLGEDGEPCDVMIDAAGNEYPAKQEDKVYIDKLTGEALKCGDIVQIVKSKDRYVKHIDILYFADKNASNGYGYTYTNPGNSVRNTTDKIIAVGDLDDDRLIASGYIKTLTPSYITISNAAGEEAVFGIKATNIKLYTVYTQSRNITEESTDQLNIGDYVVIKCAQSNLKEIVRYFN